MKSAVFGCLVSMLLSASCAPCSADEPLQANDQVNSTRSFSRPLLKAGAARAQLQTEPTPYSRRAREERLKRISELPDAVRGARLASNPPDLP